MIGFQFLQPLVPSLSAILVAVIADILLRLIPQARDRLDPLMGIPARFAIRLNAKLNRAERNRKTRAVRGIITFVVLLVIGAVLAVGIEAFARRHEVIEPFFWFLCFRLTFPWSTSVDLLKVWKDKQTAAAQGSAILERRRVTVLVPTKNPDRHAVARMMIEATATSLHRGFLTPVLWGCVAALFGLPALAVAIFVTFLLEAERVIVTQETLDSPFAMPFQIAEAIIDFIPARVGALFWVLGSVFTPGTSPGGALKVVFRQSDSHRAVNSGWPVAAVAGALKVALPGGKKRDGWIGQNSATARASEGDVQRVLWLHATTTAVTVLILTATMLLALAS